MRPFEQPDPCSQSWNEMRADGPAVDGASPTRACAACAERVYDFEAMTEDEIRGLVAVKGEGFCARQTVRGGALVTWRRLTRGVAVAGALVAAAWGLGGVAQANEPGRKMGKVAFIPPSIERAVAFASDSATLSKDRFALLDAVASVLARDPSIALVQVTGNTTAAELAQKDGGTLAYRRAEAVRDYLVGKGLAPSRFVLVVGSGAQANVQVHDITED